MKYFLHSFVLIYSLYSITLCQPILHSPTDKQILQQALDGLFEQNNMPYPKTIINCMDDKTANKIVYFITTELQNLATYSSSLYFIIFLGRLKQAYNGMDPKVHLCLMQNQQLTQWKAKYGIQNSDITEITMTVLKYANNNFQTVNSWFGPLNDQWKGEKYHPAGYVTAGYMHLIFKAKAENLRIQSQKDYIGKEYDEQSIENQIV